jgi:hypothetical protein
VNSWPTTFVLDRKGVIRYRNVRQGEMVGAKQQHWTQLADEPTV